jgi:hypothetical protein
VQFVFYGKCKLHVLSRFNPLYLLTDTGKESAKNICAFLQASWSCKCLESVLTILSLCIGREISLEKFQTWIILSQICSANFMTRSLFLTKC